MSVVVETTIGDFTVDLFTSRRPQTTLNFLKLCKIKYYNWSLFHTVQSGFIAQTGDPTSKGNGGESIFGHLLGEKARFYEAEKMPKIKHDKAGLLSMVNCGDNMLGSQFFITLAPQLQSLDGEHCVFGEIVEGLEVILKFNEAICDATHRPFQDIRISHIVVLEDPFDDPEGLIIPDRSPEPTAEVLQSDRIGADESIDDTAGKTTEEITEMQKDQEARARATILEMVGDIPDKDIAPPENVLFVCKLNPVTTDDDLEIIFSRFGKIVGCEVIRDHQTGDSLQYAFIEFADRKSCEAAYFKMDNVLIDERRIHVDFSQSVAKMRWRGKGKGIQYFDERKKQNSNRNVKERKPFLKDRNFEDERRFRKRRSRSRSREKSRRERSRSPRDRKREKSRERFREEKYKSRDRSRNRSDKHREKERNRERSRSRHERKRDRRDRSEEDERKRNKKDRKRERSRDRREKEDYSPHKSKDRRKKGR